MNLFELGRVVMTSGVKEQMEQDPSIRSFLDGCLKRHSEGDWGDLCKEDKELNNIAILAEKNNKDTDSLLSAYKINKIELWIITEYDRSITTILLPEEY